MKLVGFMISTKEVSMNSLFMGKYRPAIILTLALTIFLASCKPSTKSWVVSTLAGIVENPPGKDDTSVSYTHLTLPTIYSV